MSLLNTAKQIPLKRERDTQVSPETIELAIAWANGEVTLSQATQALHKASNMSTYQVFAVCFRQALRDGVLMVCDEL